MYVLLGVTRGDELIRSTIRALYASSRKDRVEDELAKIQHEHDDWLSKNETSVPKWVKCSIYSRFEIQEVDDDAEHKRKF